MSDDENYSDFGFSSVPSSQKSGLVRGIFNNVAGNYDLMNDLMSGGMHRIWKSILLDRVAARPGQTLIDVAGGTGDIAEAFLKRAHEWATLNTDTSTHDGTHNRDMDADSNPEKNHKKNYPGDNFAKTKAIICDINHAMLVAGSERDDHNHHSELLTRICGDAEKLPLMARRANVYTIAFGIRNVTDKDAALREAYRVLRPGGRFFCLEFSHPIIGTLQKIYDQYSFNIIPWLGEKVADDRDSYQYLVESIRRFPSQESFAHQIKQAGFSRVKYENLSGGIAAIHSGWRL